MADERFIMKDGLIYDTESEYPQFNIGRKETLTLLNKFYEENLHLKQQMDSILQIANGKDVI